MISTLQVCRQQDESQLAALRRRQRFLFAHQAYPSAPNGRSAALATTLDSAETAASKFVLALQPRELSCATLQSAMRDSPRNRDESFRGMPAPNAVRETLDALAPSAPRRRAQAAALCRAHRCRQ